MSNVGGSYDQITCLNKRLVNPNATNEIIDKLYTAGLMHGASGGKLLGSGAGGYILFYHPPTKRNQLAKALHIAGGEIMNFNFDFEGTQIWPVKHPL